MKFKQRCSEQNSKGCPKNKKQVGKNDERINFFWKTDNNGIYLFVFFNNKP